MPFIPGGRVDDRAARPAPGPVYSGMDWLKPGSVAGSGPLQGDALAQMMAMQTGQLHGQAPTADFGGATPNDYGPGGRYYDPAMMQAYKRASQFNDAGGVYGRGPTPDGMGFQTGTASRPMMAPGTTLGSMAKGITLPGASPGAASSPAFGEASGNYSAGMTPADYINPAAKWATDQGLNAVKSSYAGAGDFLSGSAMKGISDYATSSGLDKAWQPGFGNYMADKSFNYGVDNNDRNFGYQAANNDRNFNYGVNNNLAQLAMQGTQGAAANNNWLAGLLAQNAAAAGQASGTGTIGQGNSISQAISQILGQYQSNSMLNRIFPNGGG